MIEVVSAVIARDGRVLLSQRREGKDFAFSFETPGGMVEGGETHHEALRREVREELGIDAQGIDSVPIFTKEYGAEGAPNSRRIRFLVYVVRSFEGRPMSREGQGFGWFTAQQTRYLTLSLGTYDAIDKIVPVVDATRRAA